MKLRPLLPAMALAVAPATAALAQQADPTGAASVICTPDRLAQCESDGKCRWKEATARDRQLPLVIDFKAKRAFIRNKDENREIGLVLEDKLSGDARQVVISKDESRNPATTMTLTLARSGKLTGTRSEGRIRIEATCTVAS